MKLPRVAAGMKPPPIHWWGNAFYRVWKDWEQLVIVIRLPWWAEYCDVNRDVVRPCQFVVSWRQREGWRHGWRAA